jgi:hypothetical protein
MILGLRKDERKAKITSFQDPNTQSQIAPTGKATKLRIEIGKSNSLAKLMKMRTRSEGSS